MGYWLSKARGESPGKDPEGGGLSPLSPPSPHIVSDIEGSNPDPSIRLCGSVGENGDLAQPQKEYTVAGSSGIAVALDPPDSDGSNLSARSRSSNDLLELDIPELAMMTPWQRLGHAWRYMTQEIPKGERPPPAPPGFSRWLEAVGWSFLGGFTVGWYIERYKIKSEPKPPLPHQWEQLSKVQQGKLHVDLDRQRMARMISSARHHCYRWPALTAPLFGVQGILAFARQKDDGWNLGAGAAVTGLVAAHLSPGSRTFKLKALIGLPILFGGTGLLAGTVHHWLGGLMRLQKKSETSETSGGR